MNVFTLQKKRRTFNRFRLSVLLKKKKIASMFASSTHYEKSLLTQSFTALQRHLKAKQALKRSQRRVQMNQSVYLKTVYFKKLVKKFEEAVLERRKNETMILYADLETLNKSPQGNGLFSARTIQTQHNRTISKINESIRYQHSQLTQRRNNTTLQPELLNCSLDSDINNVNKTQPINDLSREEKYDVISKRISEVRERKSTRSSISRERRPRSISRGREEPDIQGHPSQLRINFAQSSMTAHVPTRKHQRSRDRYNKSQIDESGDDLIRVDDSNLSYQAASTHNINIPNHKDDFIRVDQLAF